MPRQKLLRLVYVFSRKPKAVSYMFVQILSLAVLKSVTAELIWPPAACACWEPPLHEVHHRVELTAHLDFVGDAGRGGGGALGVRHARLAHVLATDPPAVRLRQAGGAARASGAGRARLHADFPRGRGVQPVRAVDARIALAAALRWVDARLARAAACADTFGCSRAHLDPCRQLEARERRR